MPFELDTDPVPVNLLTAAIEAMRSVSDVDRDDFSARLVVLMGLVDGRTGAGLSAGVALGLDHRMQALEQFRDDPAFRAWATTDEDQHPVLIEAAATEPLVFDEGGFGYFEPMSFFRRVRP